MEKIPAVYILANKRNGTLYIGVTSDLRNRIWKHKNKAIEGFATTYKTMLLVYYEIHSEIVSAIAREKQLKKWRRDWKIRIIEEMNEEWRDLFYEI